MAETPWCVFLSNMMKSRVVVLTSWSQTTVFGFQELNLLLKSHLFENRCQVCRYSGLLHVILMEAFRPSWRQSRPCTNLNGLRKSNVQDQDLFNSVLFMQLFSNDQRRSETAATLSAVVFNEVCGKCSFSCRFESSSRASVVNDK